MNTSNNANLVSLSQEGLPLVKDLMRPSPAIYWVDYLSCTLVGWLAFALTMAENTEQWARPLWFLVASLCLYRSVIFVHELVHLKPGSVPFFRGVWMILSVPLLIPLFSYEGVHLDHHRRNLYGTSGDGEYFPFVKKGRLFILTFLVGNLLLPFFLVFRHIILTPLSFLSKRIQRWTWARVSSLAIDPAFERPQPTDGKYPVLEPVLGFTWCTSLAVAISQGWISWWWAICWFAMAATVLALNAARTLAAHRYANLTNAPLDLVRQHLDSIDVRGNLFTTLWAPVGLRYHATHHLFPTLPYHNLGAAHRRLNQGLVTNAELYRQSTRPGIAKALSELWVSAGRGEDILVPSHKTI